ncbi:MAG: endonuclease/exonuclease/phosphatase family protein [Chloroflexota bacterium]
MKCLTLNIWNYQHNWKVRKALICGLINDEKPDVAVLQEVRHDFRYERGLGQGEQIAALTGYHLTWRRGQIYLPFPRVDEGIALLTPSPPERVFSTLLSMNKRDPGDRNRRLCLGVALRDGNHEVHVYGTHFGLSPEARTRNARSASAFIRHSSGTTPSLVMGDLNGELHEAAIRFLTGRQSIEGETGDFFDCWEHANPDAPGYTYASWEPVSRIDYVLARSISVPIRARLVGNVATNGVFPSDHIGIVTEFAL